MADHRGYWTAVGKQLLSWGERGIDWFRRSPSEMKVLVAAGTGLTLLFTTFLFISGTMMLASALTPDDVESISTPAVSGPPEAGNGSNPFSVEDSRGYSGLGDYRSEEEYLAEVDDTTQKLDGIWDDTVAIDTMYKEGIYIGSEAAYEVRDNYDDVVTHTDFFFDREPPEAYAGANEELIEMLYTMEEGLAELELAYRNTDRIAYQNAIDELSKVFDMAEQIGNRGSFGV